MTTVRFTVDSPPAGKDRHRSYHRGDGRHGTYNPGSNVTREAEIRKAWREQSGERFDRGVPLVVYVNAYLPRPAGHYRKGGLLSKAGLSSPYPTKKPDWDNLGKLIGDALNSYAYHDDAQIVTAVLVKRWCESGETPRTSVVIKDWVDAQAVERKGAA